LRRNHKELTFVARIRETMYPSLKFIFLITLTYFSLRI